MEETRYSAFSRSPQASIRSRTAVDTPEGVDRNRVRRQDR